MDKPTENQNVLTIIAMMAATTMIAQHIAGKATRDALFLTYYAVERLPLMMMISAVVSIAMVLLMSRLLTRVGPARLIPIIFGLSAALLVLQWQVIDFEPRAAAGLLYLQVSAVNSVLISGFWSVINERFDPYSAKKVIARLAAAAALGGLVGGLAAKLVASFADTHAILLMLALMHVVCAIAVAYIGGGRKIAHTEDAPANLLAPLRSSSLIRRMALLALLVATTAAMLDYLLKAEAAKTLSSEQLITFFSYFYVGVGLCGFLLQSVVGDKALKWFGLGGTMIIWPLAIMTTGMAALFMRTLVTVTVLRASANMFYNSFFRTGFELLYTPIPAADKRTGKVMIDVGADRSGDMLGGLIVMAILALPVFSESLLLLVALGLSVLVLILVLVLHRNYVSQLATNLKSGMALPDTLAPATVGPSHSLDSAQTTIHRDELLREIAERRARQAAAGATDVPPPVAPGALADPVTDSILKLRSDDPEQIRHVLVSRALSPELIPHVITLVNDERVLPEALRALRSVSTSAAGQLTDALLDRYQHEHVRRRLPVVLGYSDSPMAITGLLAALEDTSWNVRCRAARALQMIKSRNPHASIRETALLAAAEGELRALVNNRRGSGRGGQAAIATPQRLEMIFLLLGALDDPGTIELCWNALHSGDSRLRGTALEYLENRLPPDLWQELHTVLAAEHGRDRRSGRSQQEAASELHAAAARLRQQASPVPADSLAGVMQGGNRIAPAEESDNNGKGNAT